jgi:hypothetical protein
MAGFKTHVSVSTALGVGYGAIGVGLDYPLETCMLAAGLCGVSGMLPDLDSKSGVPVREMMALAAAVTPMMMIDRFQHMGLGHESIVLAGALIYIVIRFGVGEIFKLYTVHRGMWHSIPAAVTCGLLALFICSCDDYRLRVFKAFAVFLGFMSHLVLDELWSIQLTRGRIRLKSSFGTAIKFWSKSLWGNVSTYAKLIAMIALTMGDPLLMQQLGVPPHESHVPHTAYEWLEGVLSKANTPLRQASAATAADESLDPTATTR